MEVSNFGKFTTFKNNIYVTVINAVGRIKKPMNFAILFNAITLSRSSQFQ